jgi:hypothetical protein
VAPPVQEKKESAAPTPAHAANNGQPATGNSRRLSKNIFDDLTQRVNDAATRKNEVKIEFTVALAQQLFEKYMQQLQAEGKNVAYAQFTMMRLEVLPPDELRIISPSELTDTYAREQRTQLLDFYREETQSIIRIITEIQEDKSVIAEQNKKVLSRSEMFEAMAHKNPSLGRLKDALNMTIEY